MKLRFSPTWFRAWYSDTSARATPRAAGHEKEIHSERALHSELSAEVKKKKKKRHERFSLKPRNPRKPASTNLTHLKRRVERCSARKLLRGVYFVAAVRSLRSARLSLLHTDSAWCFHFLLPPPRAGWSSAACRSDQSDHCKSRALKRGRGEEAAPTA